MSQKELNLGILAHVDAGKTTLTERLLYEAGVIRDVGSVDAGTTQTDTLALERQRGITIKSAVTSFASRLTTATFPWTNEYVPGQPAGPFAGMENRASNPPYPLGEYNASISWLPRATWALHSRIRGSYMSSKRDL